jgi:cell wall-associated NlpC family hydrolase
VLPDGETVRIEGGSLRRAVDAGADPRRTAIRLARSMCGVTYHWGGTSPWGFDCSGLVQWAYALAGVPLPRDAGDQQAVVPPTRGPLRPGDLLFFGHGRTVNHVALVSRPPRVVHAYGQVEETCLDRSGRPELGAILLGAGRPWPPAGR